MERFNAFNLFETVPVGSKYTWKGLIFHSGNQIFEKLDQDFCNANKWLNLSDRCVKVLARVDFSDHHLILIISSGNVHQEKVKYFRFESAWKIEVTYINMIKQTRVPTTVVNENLKQVQDKFKNGKNINLSVVVGQKKRTTGPNL